MNDAVRGMYFYRGWADRHMHTDRHMQQIDRCKQIDTCTQIERGRESTRDTDRHSQTVDTQTLRETERDRELAYQ